MNARQSFGFATPGMKLRELLVILGLEVAALLVVKRESRGEVVGLYFLHDLVQTPDHIVFRVSAVRGLGEFTSSSRGRGPCGFQFFGGCPWPFFDPGPPFDKFIQHSHRTGGNDEGSGIGVGGLVQPPDDGFDGAHVFGEVRAAPRKVVFGCHVSGAPLVERSEAVPQLEDRFVGNQNFPLFVAVSLLVP